MSSALPWIVGGAALGVGVLWLRARQAAKATPPAGGISCELAAAAGVPKELCSIAIPVITGLAKAAAAVVDSVAKTSGDVAKWDANNKALNGAVKIPWRDANSVATSQLAIAVQDGGGGGRFPALDGTVVEFENGCQPMKGSPGWAKCKPGTVPMFNYPPLGMYFVPDGNTKSWGRTNFAPMTGAVRREGEPEGLHVDPFTAGGFVAGSKFPIPIPDGHVGYYYRARPFTCPKGKPPNLGVRDHRLLDPDYTPPCGGSWTPQGGQTRIVGATVGGTSRQEWGGNTGVPAPDGYHWVEPTATVGGHWERDRA